MNIQWVTHLSMDSFYKVSGRRRGEKRKGEEEGLVQVLTPEQHEAAARGDYNFDHPDAFDTALLKETISRLKEGKAVSVPVYNFTTHSREKEQKTMYGADVIIFEGILSLYHPDINALMDLKIFVDTGRLPFLPSSFLHLPSPVQMQTPASPAASAGTRRVGGGASPASSSSTAASSSPPTTTSSPPA